MKYLAWLSANWIVLALVALLGFLLLFGIRGCRDKDEDTRAAVMAERVRSDSVIHRADSIAYEQQGVMLSQALAHGTQVVEHWNTVKVPLAIPSTATPHDTIASIAKRLSACYSAGDTLVQSIVKIQTACSAFRDTATKTIKDQRTAYAHLDSLLRLGKHAKRWGVGPYIGAGFYQDQNWAIKRGITAGISLHYNVLSW